MDDDLSLSDEINELIKMDGELENELKSQLETLEKYQKIDSSLSYSNWSSKNYLQDITKKNEYYSEKIKQMTEAYDDYNSKLKLLKLEKSELAKITWQRFMEVSQHYQHLIISAQKEYKSDNLMSDIHRYDNLLEELNYQSLDIVRHMEELKAHYGLSELGTNPNTKHLEEIQSFINSLKKDQLPISLIIRNYENEKNNIIKKMEQKESDIKYLISKKK